jgi:hypothetical protein
MKKFLLFIFLVFSLLQINAQIVIEPLGSNDIIKEALLKKKTNFIQKDGTPLELPFIEDFSYEGPFPRSDYWSDSSAFINWDYPIDPPSYGVATLDGFDKNGNPYSTVFEEHGPADTLTSRSINLNYSAADSIYMSFFYQPKGRGNYPEFEDSLRLEFYQANQDQWTYAWSVVGQDFPQTDIRFRQVLIPVTDTSFLTGEFKFRFINYASLHAGYDHWHIDYIRIDRNRNRADSLFNDIAFVDKPLSLLKEYQSMPYRHYVLNPLDNMADFFTARVTTLRSTTTNYDYKYQIFNEFGEMRDFIEFEPQTNFPYREINSITRDAKYAFDVYNQPYAMFYIDYILNTQDNLSQNDSMLVYQALSNYYAYDDGTAEERLSIVSGGGGFLGVRFDIKKTDTLRAVQFYFNQVNQDNQEKPFYIFVWNNANNRPGSIAYQSEELQPIYPNGVNKFATYVLKDPPVLQQGTYYIGWVQTSNFALNVGFDRNINTASKIFFNTTNAWNQLVSQEGSLMIRPLFGTEDDIAASNQNLDESNILTLFPNPAYQSFQVSDRASGMVEVGVLHVFDISGKLVTSQSYTTGEAINCGDWNNGIYFVHFTNNKGKIKRYKLIVSH